MKWLPIALLFFAAAVAGCGGDETGSTQELAVSDPIFGDAKLDSVTRSNLVLAEVGGHRIYGSDLTSHLETVMTPSKYQRLKNNPNIMQGGLSALVDKFVWAEMARRNGIDLLPHEERQVRALEARLLADHYLKEILVEKASPSEEEVLGYYQANQAQFLGEPRVALRHILVPDQAKAMEVLQELQGGADFGDLVRAHTQDENTRDLGGALGYVSRGARIITIGKNADFEKQVLTMETGGLKVLETPLGWHVIRCEKKEGGVLLPLEEVRGGIEFQMMNQNYAPVYNAELYEARDETNTVLLSKNFDLFTGTDDYAGQIMLQAEKSGTREALEIYRRVCYDFRDSPGAPRAQFMVAYLYRVGMEDIPRSRQALRRLQSKFPRSDWRKAGDWLMEHLEEDPGSLGTPEEILARVTEGE